MRGRDGGGQGERERNICQREDSENKLTDAQFKPCLHSNYSKMRFFFFFHEESPSLLKQYTNNPWESLSIYGSVKYSLRFD